MRTLGHPRIAGIGLLSIAALALTFVAWETRDKLPATLPFAGVELSRPSEMPSVATRLPFTFEDKLDAPLDVFVVRKLGLPGYPELAMGAIATGGVRVLNRDVIDSLRISDDVIDAVTANEQRELERRERSYRDDLPPPDVHGKTVIIVDDGSPLVPR